MYSSRKLLEEKQPFVIFGCDITGMLALEYLKDNGIREIIGFCDNNPVKWGKIIKDIFVFCPREAVRNRDATFLISAGSYRIIQKQLEREGIPKEQTIPFFRYGYFRTLPEDEQRDVLEEWYYSACRGVYERLPELRTKKAGW